MHAYYCIINLGVTDSAYTGEEDFSKVEGKCLPVIGDEKIGIPVFTMYQSNCLDCEGSADIEECQNFDLMVGYITFPGEDYLYNLVQLLQKYTSRELNDIAQPAMFKSMYGGGNGTEFDFCDNKCFAIGLNPYELGTPKVVSPYFTEILGHCRDSVNYEQYSLLAGKPPDDLVETYFRCKPTRINAFFDSVGIANGNTALFAPLVLLLLLVPLIQLYFKASEQHLHEEEYSNEDRDEAGREMMKQLLSIAHGKSSVASNSVLARFVTELQALAQADKEQIQRKRKSTIVEESNGKGNTITNNPILSERAPKTERNDV